LVSLGFVEAKSDTSLFIYYRNANTTYLMLYVDDIILTSSPKFLQRTTTTLQQQLAMKDLGHLHFLDVSVGQQRPDNLFLHQCQYARDILVRWHERLHHVSRHSRQGVLQHGHPVIDPTAYHSLVKALQYLTFNRSDISYVVQQVCLHMHDPHELHLTAAKRILYYLQGAIDHGLFLHCAATSELVVH
jgi:predicted nucleotide-binding protein (sugar kinase/HSP70/actin superfamily)